jgi:hypothetical protein
VASFPLLLLSERMDVESLRLPRLCGLDATLRTHRPSKLQLALLSPLHALATTTFWITYLSPLFFSSCLVSRSFIFSMTQRVVGCSVVTGIYSFLYPLLLYMVLYLYHHTTYLLSIYIPFGSFSCHITGYLYFPHFVVEMFVYYSGIDGPTIYIYIYGRTLSLSHELVKE